MDVKISMLFRIWKRAKTLVATNLMPYRQCKITEEQWDDGYSEGRWDYLRSLEQLAHYKVIAGYYGYFCQRGAILDVGCGEGYLQEHLSLEGYSRYLGIDISVEAINAALHRKNETTSFLKVDVSDLQLNQHFDVIIFNESLYYFENPLLILNKYAFFLSEKGHFIISMTDSRPFNARLWEMIESAYPIIDEVKVMHGSGKGWTIKVFGRGTNDTTNHGKPIDF